MIVDVVLSDGTRLEKQKINFGRPLINGFIELTPLGKGNTVLYNRDYVFSIKMIAWGDGITEDPDPDPGELPF